MKRRKEEREEERKEERKEEREEEREESIESIQSIQSIQFNHCTWCRNIFEIQYRDLWQFIGAVIFSIFSINYKDLHRCHYIYGHGYKKKDQKQHT